MKGICIKDPDSYIIVLGLVVSVGLIYLPVTYRGYHGTYYDP